MSNQLSRNTLPAETDIQNRFPDRLTIFSFMWACQAIVHQDYYSNWMHAFDPRGWMLTILAIGVMLRPSSLAMFSGMLTCSIVYNVFKWPFVVNHILVESVVNLVILAAIGSTLIRNRGSQTSSAETRKQIFQRFVPVLTWMVVLIYAFAFVAKLNTDFFNVDVSCVVAMYGDVLRRFPFLPDNPVAHHAAIYMTLVVEALIPLLLAFRRTRPLGVILGIPFHVVLGLVGHRTFSALAFAMYVMLCMDGIRPVVLQLKEFIDRKWTTARQTRILHVVWIVATVGLGSLIWLEVAGESKTKIAGIIRVYQVSYVLWACWSLAIGLGIGAAILRIWRDRTEQQTITVRPGMIWLAIPLLIFMGLSQYIGVKTETCFTMYSNLRTEGDWNNHLFMPALRLGGFQTDLVKVTQTDHPELQELVEHDDLITFFELRRIVASTSCDTPFFLHYIRDATTQNLEWTGQELIQSEHWGKHPLILGKLLFFRPIPTADCVPCRH